MRRRRRRRRGPRPGLGARRLGRLARRPQTGLLHQYYAQAAVCFVVLTVFLLLVG
ncbi:hypothetical protein [Streptomyces sp. C8S0]|uniref:hypothetical protein n=1 Tax=Streptomyces sp. C8S0 TaxID=2585716 RepID=UPI001867DF71|nr:hypothetical protein [Streptomyces sp. C8S0]